ncbi:MAG TPA: choice-of-anchor D domain-containing protein [Candidatus Cloacimonadota bacterium]|nr:choice-of-anchor D domain-containing protein [Candidatus Cloacimonadota bacterium]
MRSIVYTIFLLAIVSLLGATTLVDTGAGITPLSHGASAWGDYDNDGDLDIIMTGLDPSGTRTTKLYRNDNGVFTDIVHSIPGVERGSVSWRDYDGDGDIDLLITGRATSGLIARIYRNDNGEFVDIVAGLTGVYNSSAAWGDFDNDGDLDIALCGASSTSSPFSPVTIVYTNTNGVFSATSNLTGVYLGSIAWVDIDNDADLDLVFNGATVPSPYDPVFKLFLNTNGVLAESATSVPGGYNVSMDWADYDNDGFLDLLYSGMIQDSRSTKLYRNDNGILSDSGKVFTGLNLAYVCWADIDNNGDVDIITTGNAASGPLTRIYSNENGTFSIIATDVISVHYAWVSAADYDNDGDLDLLLLGASNLSGTTRVSKIYRNDDTPLNNPPTSPSNLRRYVSGTYTIFQWDPAEDDNNSNLSYSLRIGTSPGANNVMAGMSDSSGARKIAKPGYANSNLTWKIKNTTLSTTNNYYWSVQAIDGAYKGSPFAPESVIKPINVTSPNGGEIWSASETRTVHWSRNPNVSNVNIYISSDNGNTWILLNESVVSASLGSYSFVVPALVSSQCLIKVVSSANSALFDVSDSVFTIVSGVANYVRILSPNTSGLTLLAGRQVNITWEQTGVEDIKIELTSDHGQSWTIITESYPAASGTYAWTVPDFLSLASFIRVTDAANPLVYDWNDFSFKMYRLTILAPNGGEVFKRGRTTTITWTTNYPGNFRLQYSANNGSTWTTIVSSIAGSNQTYDWAIFSSSSPGDQYLIKMYSLTDAAVFDTSDGNFTVVSLSVTYPSIADLRLQAGKEYAITWSQGAVTTNVCLEYTTDGTNFTLINNAIPPSPGSYTWLVPEILSSSCKIRISLADYPSIDDLSDNFFTICKLQLTSPNGGETLTSGTTHVIRWAQSSITNVRLDYSTNGGSTWTTIVTSTPASALSYSWTVPSLISYNCLIRIRDTAVTEISDFSDSIFTIRTPIIVTTPNGGENMTVGSPYNISWTTSGDVPFILIDYSINNGSTWLPVVSSAYPATTGTYQWIVPNTPSNNCLVKVKKSTDNAIFDVSDGTFIITPTIYPPTPDFTSDVVEGLVPLTVQFTDLSIAGSGVLNQWNWDFGDGSFSQLQNPQHIYQEAGVFSVSLAVSNSHDSTRTVIKNNYITANSNLPVIALLTPTEMDFGNKNIGEYTSWMEVQLQNIGSIPLDIEDLYLGGDNGFAYQRASEFTEINPGEIDTILVRFKPKFLGAVEDVLTIQNSSGNWPVITITLTGAGLALLVPTQYSTIQAAIDAANSGNCILVDDGVYYENLQIVGKEVILASRYYADGDTLHIYNTIIDGSQVRNPDQASVIAILPGNNPYQSPHIIGLTIRNGRGWLKNEIVGSSIVQKRVGGGIYIQQSNPIFTANRVIDNQADDEGGGSYAFQSSPNFGGAVIGRDNNPGDNVFLRNTSDLGKDLYINATHTRDEIKAENCKFEVFASVDTTLSTYWATTTNPVSYQGGIGNRDAINSDIYVATNGNNETNTGLSPDSPFKSIDYALSLAYGTAENPITVHVASGIYSADFTGERFPLQMVDWVSLKGEGIENTVIDAGASSVNPTRIITCDNVVGVSIEDLAMINGFVTNIKNLNGGGIAILKSQVNISRIAVNNSFSAGDGAGIFVFGSSVVCDSILVEYNQATGSGGAISSESSEVSITNSVLSHNFTSKHGGGLYQNNGVLNLESSLIQHNNANSIQMRGGGLSLISIANPTVSRNIISSNSGFNGGGVSMQNCSAIQFKNNKITNNTAMNWGGALYHITTTGNLYNNLIANNTASQRGGAIYANSSIAITNSTIANNRAFSQGGAIYNIGSSSSYVNSILWNNSAPVGNELYLYDNTSPNFRYCDIMGGSSSFGLGSGVSYNGTYTNNIASDPLFVAPTASYGVSYDALNADWRLQDLSPCINAGDPLTDASEFPVDLGDMPRIISSIIDIGAHENDDTTIAVIGADPSDSIDYGKVIIDSEPMIREIVVTNHGTAALIISEIYLQTPESVFSWEFEGLDQNILPNESVTIYVSLDPTELGEQENTLNIINNSANEPGLSIGLHAQVMNNSALISLVPDTQIDFGQLVLGAPMAQQEILITNNGLAPLQITGIAFNEETTMFDWDFDLIDEDILPDETVSLVVSFNPEEIGEHAITLEISNNSENSPLATIELVASVIDNAPIISAQPDTEIEFGQVVLLSDPVYAEITITNIGHTPLMISDISLSDDTSVFTWECDDYELPIAPEDSIVIQVIVSPNELGIHNNTLDIYNNSSNLPIFTIDLSVDIISGDPIIEADPESQLVFGQIIIGSASVSHEILLTNTGTAPLVISEIEIFPETTVYQWECDTLEQDILPGASVIISVTLNPDEIGEYIHTLVVTNNSSNQPELSIELVSEVVDVPIIVQGNVRLRIIGYDACLSWDPVYVVDNGVPTLADLYLVLYSEKADASAEDFYFHGSTSDSTYIHDNVARFRDSMFYRIVGLTGFTRDSILNLTARSQSQPITWGELKKRLQVKPEH